MLIGTMNHPQHDVVEELRWMAAMGLEFVDLTVEPPAAASWQVDVEAIRAELGRSGMKVVGHTAYYLPLASPFEEVRQGSVAELKRCLEIFGRLGAKWMNIHPDRNIPMHSREYVVQRNLASLRELEPTAQRLGVGLMIENLPGEWNTAQQLGELLQAMPSLGLHLDVGHANLNVPQNTTEELLAAFGSRLAHVHLHDNKGGHLDQHLPLGAGLIDFPKYIRLLKRAGYNSTITLEVFTPDKHYLAYSAERLRTLWRQIEA